MRWTHAQDEDHHCWFKWRRTVWRNRRERERETDRIGSGRGALKIDWTSPRAHSSRFHGQALSIGSHQSGREGRAKERKERSFGVHRKVVEPGQPFGSRGAHNAAIVSRVHRPTLLPSSPSLVSPLWSPRPLFGRHSAGRSRSAISTGLSGQRTGRLNFLFRDTCNRYVRLNERSSLFPFLSPALALANLSSPSSSSSS